MKRVAVLVSGGGTNLQALIDASAQNKMPNAALCLVVASKPDVFALQRAEKAGIPARVLPRKEYAALHEYDSALLAVLQEHKIDVVVLAGFLTILGEKLIHAYPNRIINVHPSLIPAFSGPGYYGIKVHKEALARGVKITGATVHFVNEVADGGEIILQKAVEVLQGDSPEILQKRVMEQAEWQILPQALEMVCASI